MIQSTQELRTHSAMTPKSWTQQSRCTMRRNWTRLALVALLIAGCSSGPGAGSEPEWRCPPLPPDFQEADLVGTWEHRLRSHWGDRLTLRQDGTCQQEYTRKDPSFTIECTWYLEEKWGGLYLHVEGMHYCISGDTSCGSPGGGNLLYYDWCSDRVIKMPNEVVFSVTGVQDDFAAFHKRPAPRGIILRHMVLDPDSRGDFLWLNEETK
jgi:hypothetical protein